MSDKIIYKNVRELTREQLQELKRFYYSQTHENASIYELANILANIDAFVSDSEIFREYAYTSFVDDDFFCTSGFVVE